VAMVRAEVSAAEHLPLSQDRDGRRLELPAEFDLASLKGSGRSRVEVWGVQRNLLVTVEIHRLGYERNGIQCGALP